VQRLARAGYDIEVGAAEMRPKPNDTAAAVRAQMALNESEITCR
jgi:hypothetical protein